MEQWREWIRDLREEGYSKQEIQDYLEEEGYDPGIVHEFWEDDEDSYTDLSYISHDYMAVDTMGHGLTQLRPDDYTNALVNILSSPEGTIRRSSMSVSGMILFFLINVVGFLLGATMIDVLIGLVFSSDPLPRLLGTAFVSGLTTLIPYLIGGVVMTIWLSIGGLVLGERGKKRKTIEAVSYGTMGLLLMWIPIIGPLFGFLTLYIWFQAIKEVHAPMTRMRAMALLGLPALVYMAWLGQTAIGWLTGLVG